MAHPDSQIPRLERVHVLISAVLGALYAIYVITQWGVGYIDFGDGNYLYISRRIAEGVVVYRDLLAPQPPCHLFLGALIWKIAWLVELEAAEAIYLFRAFSLMLHLASWVLVMHLALKAWGSPTAATIAGAIFLYLPIGHWWSLGYQSEPLEIFWLLLMMWFALRDTRASDVATGIFAALAALTNATAAPFLLVLIIYMLIRAPKRAIWMSVPCILLAAAVTWVLQGWTGGAYLDNVVFNQVGTYPKDRFWAYAWGKLIGQWEKTAALEGAFLFVALLGVVRYLRTSPLEPVGRDGLAWFSLATMASIIYVTKGGTVNYIFSLSEPAVAILAAGELSAWGARWRRGVGYETGRRMLFGVPNFWLKTVAALMLACFALLPGINFHVRLWQQAAYELPEGGVNRIAAVIERYSTPGDPILSPPFYAVVADRRLWGEYSEIFIWTINYYNDVQATPPGGKGLEKIGQMVEAINERSIPLVILEMDQTGRIPPVMQALREHYRPLRLGPRSYLFHTLYTRLGGFIPLPPEVPEELRRETDEAWRALGEEIPLPRVQ